jgi:hypothetical protein
MHPAEIMMLESALEQIDSATRALRKFVILAKHNQTMLPIPGAAPMATKPDTPPDDDDPVEAAVTALLSNFQMTDVALENREKRND